MSGIINIPTTNVAEFVYDLAKKHNVKYIKTNYDRLAEMITNLSDDEVVMDEVELLIVALQRAGVIPRAYGASLHVNYLREKFA